MSLGAVSCRPTPEPPPHPPLEKPPNIIVFLPDSLRADALGCYGYPRPCAPAVDAFARQAYCFEQCHSQATWTKPSIASLFTGVVPSVHQAGLLPHDDVDMQVRRAQVLRPQFVLLAEALKNAGYATAWFVANSVVSKRYGFAQGFDHYSEFNAIRPDDQFIAMLEWLKSEREPNPFFLFIHAIDPHYPYQPPEEFFVGLYGEGVEQALLALPQADRTFCGAYFDDPEAVRKGLSRASFRSLSAEGLAFIRRLYAAEIGYVDRQFQRLLSYLQRTQLLDESVVVFISDHGEAFGEHGLFYHEHVPLEHQKHVPLLVRMPGQTAPRRVPYTVGLYDLYPTLLGFAGQTPPGYVQAEALFSPEGTLCVDGHRTVYTSYDHHNHDTGAWTYGVRRGAEKLLINRAANKVLAFDLDSDPGETRDLAAQGALPPAFARLQEHFEMRYADNTRLGEVFGPPEWLDLEREALEDLDALGYL